MHKNEQKIIITKLAASAALTSLIKVLPLARRSREKGRKNFCECLW
jgi:hypothetical protein